MNKGTAGFGLLVVSAALALGAAVASADTDMGPDGLPKDIPAPGSKPPTTDEWNAMTKEVTVKGSSAYHCETKMVREWLRVTCYPYDKWTLKDVKTKSSEGQQAFVGMFGPKASVVVQVVKNKKYVARYTWAPDGSTRDLTVNWPTGAPRPTFAFN
ncbi:MAG TPA: hypothetical protein VGM56_27180 [Byssovorax sp.]|jgi:hypothetical protein